MSNAEQGKIIKEIKHLNENVETAARLSQIKPRIAELRKEKDGYYDELKVFRTEVNEFEKELEVLRKQMETINEGKSDINKQIDAINDKITKVQADISALYAKKDEQREVHFKNRYDYEV